MRIHWLWLSSMTRLSAQQKRKLLQLFGDPEQVYNADPRVLQKTGILSESAVEQLANKDLTPINRLMTVCERKGIGFITIKDSNYPTGLRSLEDGPIVLFYKGVLPDFEHRPMIGIVGTRSATLNGLRTAQKLGGEIALCGGVVVSGGAVGIDIRALRGAHAAGMPTVTILAGGLDQLYPRENEEFLLELCQKGCLLSETPPGAMVYKASFLQRNRLISGISQGVVVVEAPARSGSLNTARWAREQGKDLFAVPGAADMGECAGNNRLLDDGAVAATSGWAVMRTYANRYPDVVAQRSFNQAFAPQEPAVKPKSDKKDIDKSPAPAYSVIEKQLPPLNEKEQALVNRLKNGPEYTDILAAQEGMDTGALMRLITVLTMKGVIDTNHEGKVFLK